MKHIDLPGDRMRLAVLFGTLLILCACGVSAMSNDTDDPRREAAEIYSSMRQLALQTKASEIGAAEASSDAYGVVMDIDVDGNTATITSFTTGDASLYLSTGGGTIGGIGHENVSISAKKFVQVANANRNKLSAANGLPRPGAGEVTFYVLTSKGVLAAKRPEQELGEGRSDLTELFYAGQDVLTQIRLSEENR